MLNLYKLEIFAQVAREGSFSAAAERLYMTQSAVSQHMHDLEASLGARLFVRSSRGVSLTPRGRTLYDYAERIFVLVAEAENAVTDVEQLTEGRVSVGATPGISVYLMPEWTQAFRARYPRLTVSLQTNITPRIVEEALAHHLDLGIIEGELDDVRSPRLRALDLQTVEQQVIVGARHPWWERDTLRLDELDTQTFIMRPPNSQTRIWLDGALSRCGIHPQVGAEFDNLESIKRAVMAGTCITVLPEYVVQGELELGTLRALSIVDSPLRRTLKLIWAGDAPFTPITRAFLQSLSGQFPVVRTVV